MNRLNTDKSIAPLVAQFVPIKLDTASKEYSRWRQDHKYEGRTIPILFIVRADGETLYGKSGSLQGDDLPKMLTRALEHSGRILNAKEATTLSKAVTSFEEHKSAGDLPKAIKALNGVGRIGVPGQIASFATPASKVNEVAISTAKGVVENLQTIRETLDSGEKDAQLDAILDSMKLKSDFGALKILKPELAKFQKELGKKKDLSQLVRESKVIHTAKSATSKSQKVRAKTKLKELIDSSEIDEIKTLAQSTLDELE